MRDNSTTRIEIEALVRERDAYRRIAHAILDQIREGQNKPGLHDTTVSRQASRYDVMAMGRLEAELERLERGTGDGVMKVFIAEWEGDSDV